jgi:selenide,water dikinase
MTSLNASASRQAVRAGATAATDVTGFGLLGHLNNLCRESGVAAELDADSIPALPGALELLADGVGVSGGGRRNHEYAAAFTTIAAHVPEAVCRLACDPTTNGRLTAGAPGSISLE